MGIAHMNLDRFSNTRRPSLSSGKATSTHRRSCIVEEDMKLRIEFFK